MADTTTDNKAKLRPMPKHVAIIMDGNNRWAKERRLPSLAGHKAGAESVRAVIKACAESGVESLTLFAFSSENWRRPEDEVNGLMDLFAWALDREVKKLAKNNIRLQVIGDKSGFSEGLQKRIAIGEALTQDCTGLCLNIAANYGGQWDIARAARTLAAQVAAGEMKLEELTAERLGQEVSLADQPLPDLCIRTGGEQRISNFLIWQFAYTELYFSPLYWPDFGHQQMLDALQDFQTRERRFGRTSEQVAAEHV
jgi:undecaprenyl diphosphate synthase